MYLYGNSEGVRRGADAELFMMLGQPEPMMVGTKLVRGQNEAQKMAQTLI